MKAFLFYQVIVAICLSLLLLPVMEREVWLSFQWGQVFMLFSLISVALSVHIFFLKKNIALFTGLIVFKWPILIYMAFRLTQLTELRPWSFVMGFSPILLTAFIWSYRQRD